MKKPQPAHKKFQTQRERKGGKERIPVAVQVKRNERKVKKLLKGTQETYMDKVFREMEEETRRHTQIEERRSR